jgi:hypothetical protein
VIRPLARDDPSHYKKLQAFLEEEAAAFRTNIDIENLVTAVRKNRIQVLFVLADGETVGCATQFPTALPEWKSDERRFHFTPAIHSEDMSVARKGSGTPFMRQRVTMAATEGRNCGFDLGGTVRAGALVGEQKWHGPAENQGTAIGGLLSKFSADMAKDKSDTVLSLDVSEFPTSNSRRDISALSLAYPEACTAARLTVRPDVFAVKWGPKDVEKIAATFTLGVSTFTGRLVVRVHIKSNGNLANDSEVKSAMASILAEGRTQILDRGWIEKTVDPLSRMYIHALGEKEIRGPLKEVGAHDRLIGDYLMYPLVMRFANIPPAMAMDLPDATPFVPISKPRAN